MLDNFSRIFQRNFYYSLDTDKGSYQTFIAMRFSNLTTRIKSLLRENRIQHENDFCSFSIVKLANFGRHFSEHG
jgi:hypothetical protein